MTGFALESVIEVNSAAAVARQVSGPDPERRERVALRVIAGSFFALAAYVTVEALRALITGNEPERSKVGIVLVALSVVVMPLLSWAQRRAGRELGSAVAVADSKQTLLCTYLSAAGLLGLVLNAACGWWWADPLVALGLAVVAVREGREALHGETCRSPSRLDDDGAEEECGCAPAAPVPAARSGMASTSAQGPAEARRTRLPGLSAYAIRRDTSCPCRLDVTDRAADEYALTGRARRAQMPCWRR